MWRDAWATWHRWPAGVAAASKPNTHLNVGQSVAAHCRSHHLISSKFGGSGRRPAGVERPAATSSRQGGVGASDLSLGSGASAQASFAQADSRPLLHVSDRSSSCSSSGTRRCGCCIAHKHKGAPACRIASAGPCKAPDGCRRPAAAAATRKWLLQHARAAALRPSLGRGSHQRQLATLHLADLSHLPA